MSQTSRMNRRTLLRGALSGAGLAALPALSRAQAEATTPPPNIVYILMDDLGYGDLSCLNPESKIQTPHCDRIAREGMTFTDAHSGSAVCTPTRYGVLTGRYSWRGRLKRGVLYGYSDRLIEQGRATVASLLRDNGYTTACVGKWHLGWTWPRKDADKPARGENVDYTRPISNGPMDVGFDRHFGFSASLDMPPYVWVDQRTPTAEPTIDDPGSPWLAFWRKGPRAPDFEIIEVLPTLTDKASEWIAGRKGASRSSSTCRCPRRIRRSCRRRSFKAKAGRGRMATSWSSATTRSGKSSARWRRPGWTRTRC